MQKAKHITYILLALTLLATAHAQTNTSQNIQLTEVMYNPQGSDSNREWVEYYGNKLHPDTIFFEDNNDHTIHLIQGNCTKECIMIIADDASLFLQEYALPNHVLLYDSSWTSLKNSGEQIGLKYNSTILLAHTYESVANDGQSVYPISDQWLASSPTPGLVQHLTQNQVPEFNTYAILLCTLVSLLFINKKRNTRQKTKQESKQKRQAQRLTPNKNKSLAKT